MVNHLKGVSVEQLLVYAIPLRTIVLYHSLTNILFSLRLFDTRAEPVRILRKRLLKLSPRCEVRRLKEH